MGDLIFCFSIKKGKKGWYWLTWPDQKQKPTREVNFIFFSSKIKQVHQNQ